MNIAVSPFVQQSDVAKSAWASPRGEWQEQ